LSILKFKIQLHMLIFLSFWNTLMVINYYWLLIIYNICLLLKHLLYCMPLHDNRNNSVILMYPINFFQSYYPQLQSVRITYAK
jgi:hypothetical protein